MTYRSDAMSVDNGIAVTVCPFSASGYHQTDSFVRTEQIEDPDILISGVNLSHVTSLRSLFRMYGTDYSRGTLSVSFTQGLALRT